MVGAGEWGSMGLGEVLRPCGVCEVGNAKENGLREKLIATCPLWHVLCM